ncbi:MAG: hypothetical protein ACM3WV_04255 [Bacillota bacterium]
MEDSKVAILLEDIKSQFKVFGEGLQMLNEKMDTIDQKVNKLDQKVENIEIEMKNGFQKNQQEHQLMMQMIKELNEEQTKLKRAK